MREYSDVLADTHLGYLVEPLQTPARKAFSHSRFSYFDSGVVNRLVGRRALIPGTPEYGTADLHRLGAVTPLRRKLIVSRDPYPRRLGDVEVMPWRDFVRIRGSDRSPPAVIFKIRAC